jgi:thiosulfate/3-mercaptopyruvate sulfurtransferase
MSTQLLIAAEELLSRIGDPDLAIVDCRARLEAPGAGERDYLIAHIPGALFAHLDRDLSGEKTGRNGRHPLPAPEALIARFSEWGITPRTTVVAYDDVGGGLAAARLWWLLRYMGHERASLLDGGWQAWMHAGGLVQGGNQRRRPGEFVGQPHPDMGRDADFVASAALSGDWLVVDSRAGSRYRGEEEPFDPVAGHIPGARNHYWLENLRPDGRLLPPGQLRAAFERVLGGVGPERTVFYCGSGVTSAFQVFAMEVAGLPGARIYPGSWSEWSNDSSRPVATGDR